MAFLLSALLRLRLTNDIFLVESSKPTGSERDRTYGIYRALLPGLVYRSRVYTGTQPPVLIHLNSVAQF